EYNAQRHVFYGDHHDGRHRGIERRPARRVHQRAAPSRAPPARGGRPRGADPPASHCDDEPHHARRPLSHGARHRRGQRGECAARPRGDRRPGRLHRADTGPHSDAVRDARGAVPPPHRESRGGARRTRRRGMTVIAPLRLLAVIALLLAALADPGAAQPTAADPLVPRDPLPAPAGLRFITPPEIAERELGIEQAVAIALANQPTIQNRVSAYVAAQQRVAQALSPLLPQVSGLWTAFQQKSVSQVTVAGTGQNITLNTIALQTQATVTASQLLFDFGK